MRVVSATHPLRPRGGWAELYVRPRQHLPVLAGLLYLRAMIKAARLAALRSIDELDEVGA